MNFCCCCQIVVTSSLGKILCSRVLYNRIIIEVIFNFICLHFSFKLGSEIQQSIMVHYYTSLMSQVLQKISVLYLFNLWNYILRDFGLTVNTMKKQLGQTNSLIYKAFFCLYSIRSEMPQSLDMANYSKFHNFLCGFSIDLNTKAQCKEKTNLPKKNIPLLQATSLCRQQNHLIIGFC